MSTGVEQPVMLGVDTDDGEKVRCDRTKASPMLQLGAFGKRWHQRRRDLADARSAFGGGSRVEANMLHRATGEASATARHDVSVGAHHHVPWSLAPQCEDLASHGNDRNRSRKSPDGSRSEERRVGKECR